ncbi:hypothetical protein [Rhodoferax sp.]|uniref:hypothetical protein n=1 Tax=Rhodoferax sp. TaxID=50421 RepID=UPI002638666D|nr:hypothetical protein [Rhodoferax sp.]MDD3936886.1 hypothetical protein [Rhodoferax sp.]
MVEIKLPMKKYLEDQEPTLKPTPTKKGNSLGVLRCGTNVVVKPISISRRFIPIYRQTFMFNVKQSVHGALSSSSHPLTSPEIQLGCGFCHFLASHILRLSAALQSL